MLKRLINSIANEYCVSIIANQQKESEEGRIEQLEKDLRLVKEAVYPMGLFLDRNPDYEPDENDADFHFTLVTYSQLRRIRKFARKTEYVSCIDSTPMVKIL